jgi:hypothetical protein
MEQKAMIRRLTLGQMVRQYTGDESTAATSL